MIPIFQRLRLEDRTLTTFQNNVFLTLSPLATLELNNGSFLEDNGDGLGLGIALVSGQTNYVKHGLGKPASGFIVVDNQADSRVWRDAVTTNPAPDAYLLLKCSADTTVKLWVF